MKLFCDGVGVQFPDGTNASRRMKAGEFELCQKKNGVKDIIELMIGYDGLTLAFSKKNPAHVAHPRAGVPGAREKNSCRARMASSFRTLQDLETRSTRRCRTADRGPCPPPTSGTRDSLHELVLEAGAEQIRR